MQPLENLEHDHRVIERALEAFEVYVGAAESHGASRADLSRFVEFLDGFIDGAHHAKEESILFTVLAQHGSAPSPVAALLVEHDRGRGLLRALRSLTENGHPWSEQELAQLARTAKRYLEMRRAHLRMEAKNLLPVARRRLPASQLSEIDRQLELFDSRHRHELTKLQHMGEELVRRYRPGHPAGASPPS